MAVTNNSCDMPNQPQTFNSTNTLDHISYNGVASQGKQIIIATAGGTFTIANNKYIVIIKPAALLATYALIMPSSPNDGQIIRVTTTQVITFFTLQANNGQTISGAPTALGLNVGFSFIWDFSTLTWYRLY